MEPWGWILVYLVGFTLFQLLLFRYFTDDGQFDHASLGSSETSAPRSVERRSATEGSMPADEDDPAGDETGGVRCRHCGTYNENEQLFTYCRSCCNPLT
jgi:hypothetical protein